MNHCGPQSRFAAAGARLRWTVRKLSWTLALSKLQSSTPIACLGYGPLRIRNSTSTTAAIDAHNAQSTQKPCGVSLKGRPGRLTPNRLVMNLDP